MPSTVTGSTASSTRVIGNDFNQRLKFLAARADKYLIARGYRVGQHNGQRISILANANNIIIDENNVGLEVFIGKVPREMFEDELLPFFERCGTVYKIRLMMDFSGTNRGFAFIKYTNQEAAKLACEKLNNSIIRRDCPSIGVVLSLDNKRLYFGNLPYRGISKQRLLDELRKHVDGIVDIDMPTFTSSKSRYVFANFKTHEAATQARRILVPGTVKMFGRTITVDWAKTGKDEPSSSSSESCPSSRSSSSKENDDSIDLNNNSCGSIDSSSFYQNEYNNKEKLVLLDPLLATNTTGPVDPITQILGPKSWQLLESCLSPNLGLMKPSSVITICNIDLNCKSLDYLKRLFELGGHLKIKAILSVGSNSLTIEYEECKQADYMLEALMVEPARFNKLALPNSILMAFRGSTYSI